MFMRMDGPRAARRQRFASTRSTTQGVAFGPATLTVPAGRTQHFKSQDLEGGNPDKGLAAGVGTGGGDWRLELTTDADIRVLAYVRHRDGLVAAMHDTVRGTVDDAGGYLYEVPMFGPESDRHQTSLLRAINDGRRATDLTITAVDDDGVAPRRRRPCS